MSENVFEPIAEHAGHQILRRKPGFEFTPMLLGKISSLIVRPPTGGFAVFAFMFPLLNSQGDLAAADEPHLANEALSITRLAIEQNSATHGRQMAYEWQGDRWQEVFNPSWWVRIGS